MKDKLKINVWSTLKQLNMILVRFIIHGVLSVKTF